MVRLLERLFRRSTYQMGEGAASEDPLSQGLAFQVDYVGYEDMKQEPKEVFTESEKVIEQQLSVTPPPYRRLSLIISDTHLVVLQGRVHSSGERSHQLDVISNIPIYRVFYCGSHSTHTNSICVVAYSRQSKGLKCLVMLCASTKKAQTLVNVVAKAFQNAYMRWLEESKRLKKAKRAAAKAAREGLEAAKTDSDAEEAPAPTAIAAQAPEAPMSDRDRVLFDLGNLDISDSADLESERKEMHKTFSKRSKMERPEILDTGKLKVQPDDVNLTEAAKHVDTVEGAHEWNCDLCKSTKD